VSGYIQYLSLCLAIVMAIQSSCLMRKRNPERKHSQHLSQGAECASSREVSPSAPPMFHHKQQPVCRLVSSSATYAQILSLCCVPPLSVIHLAGTNSFVVKDVRIAAACLARVSDSHGWERFHEGWSAARGVESCMVRKRMCGRTCAALCQAEEDSLGS